MSACRLAVVLWGALFLAGLLAYLTSPHLSGAILRACDYETEDRDD